ncbi:MAG: polysaccharide deacetylase family protein [Desulfobacteraceae bacterium]
MHSTYRICLKASLLVLFYLMMVALPALSSSVTQRSTQSSSGHLVFRSDDYIICKLESSETPEALAKRFLNNPEKSWIIEDANEGTPFTKGEVIVIPLKQENKGGVTANGYQTVPVIGYNDFKEKCKNSSCIPGRIFDQQMKYLKDNGYRVIPMSEFLDFLYYRSAIPKRSVVITIDGGHRSAYDIAYPILKKYGFTATFLVYSDSIGIDETALTWDQLKHLKADGFEVGHFADLKVKKEKEDDQAYTERIKRELLLSKQIIDKKLSQDTPYLAFPSGKYNRNLLHICDQAGYKMAFTMQSGSNPFFSDTLSLKRNMILKEDMETFVTRLKTFHKSAGSQ